MIPLYTEPLNPRPYRNPHTLEGSRNPHGTLIETLEGTLKPKP